ncbi:MAG TPA: 16S rRNA (cytosine(1402)-N(4))-methyltransferase RsmH [Patescibacteria group bacterium]|nr:16S rRNA (cytosine(1402)-N(4))-methyltransferase RsmH [Patescibacteria group bacterium]
MSQYHTSVLLQEVLEAIQPVAGEKYIDATLGGGGHSIAIAQKGGVVLGIDQDEEALSFVQDYLKASPLSITVAQGNFENISHIAKLYGFESVAGILFDIGVSSRQLDSRERGFSFLSDAPLDMRMNKELAVTGADLVNALHKGELIELFTKYAQEPFARRIAQKIVEERQKKRIEATTQLAALVASCYPKGNHKVHPATKVFQALRIAVNDELYVLEAALPQAVDLLKKNGRLVVITFHSLEDRIVKESFKKFQKEGLGKIITEKPIIPTDEEIEKNKRARSSKLRVFEKI